MSKSRTLFNGEPVEFNPQKTWLNVECCDCGLVHRVNFSVGHRQKVTIQFWRNRRATAARRRKRQK